MRNMFGLQDWYGAGATIIVLIPLMGLGRALFTWFFCIAWVWAQRTREYNIKQRWRGKELIWNTCMRIEMENDERKKQT